nr:hypothetical protein GCM10020185_72650 [Pseudomonas brassicacearum subsp. brassicacearum]
MSFFGRGIVRVLLISPFFIMPTVGALIWKNLIFHPVSGILASVWKLFGAQPVDWLAHYPLLSIIIIVSWQWLPFAILILMTAMQSLDQEQKEAARLDGAGPIAIFWHLTLPHLARPIAVVLMIETIFLLSVFAEIFTTTNGGPGYASTNLAYLIYNQALVQFDVGMASAGGLIAVVIANIAAIILVRMIGKKTSPTRTEAVAMTLQQSRRLQSLLLGTLAWAIAILIFFPIFWMVLTSFKTEIDAFATPPQFIFTPTLENYLHINERSNYFSFAWNSVVISFSATALCLLIAVPAAYSMAFYETQRTKGTLLWMLSTKMLPPVGVLMPIYLLAKQFGLLDTRLALIVIYTLINLPIVVWMIYTYFKDIPRDILEAARLDGATLWQEMVRVLLPIAKGGLASTVLLSLILCWNEAFWSLNLTSSKAAPLTALIASYSSPEGLFWAKLSAVSTLACAPILIFGWISQKQLVRGLSFGAVK